MAIVITGTPGVGKHTIAKKLLKIQDLEIIDLNEVAIKHKIIQKSKETLDVDTKKLKEIIKGKISKKSLVVGHLAPYVLTKHQVTTAIVLRKNPYKLEPIYKKRKYSKSKILENQGSEVLGIIMYDAVKKFGHEKIIQIDTTKRTIKETVRVVKEAISGTISKDKIDWLEVIERKKDMTRFFPTN